MESWILRGPASNSRMRLCSCRSPIPGPWTCRRSPLLVSGSAVFEEVQPMKANENDNKSTRWVVRNDDDEKSRAEAETEAEASEPQEPQATGFTAQLRQLMQRSPQGEARINVKRDQHKID